MGIRRRRRKLTTLMSRLDQRVRSVELRPVNLLTSGQVEALVDPDAVVPSPETVVSASAPWQFRKIQDAYIYPKAVGYSTDRVEIYLESDLGAEVGDRIEVSGIHWASSEPIDVDGDNFTVLEVDTPPWTGRTLPNGTTRHDPTSDQLSGVTISNTYTFKPDTSAPTTWSSRRRLQTRRKVDSYSATGTTVTLTLKAVHHFEVGDIINVDIFSENSTLYGADGLFAVTAVTSTTIEYELSAGVASPTGTVDVSSASVYVFPVAREWAQDGSIWVDSSNDKTYYWDGIRWVDYTPSVSVGQDGDPPSPVTSLSVTSEAGLAGATYAPYAIVTLSWTAPTTSVSGDPITDLAGYKIRWRRSASEDWRSKTVFDSTITSYALDDDANLTQNTLYYFEVYAFDSGLQDSTAATASHTTGLSSGDHTTYPPTTPTATSRLGTITVSWDGQLSTGVSTVAAPSNIVSLNVYMSTTSGFTPGPSNLVERVRVFGGIEAFAVITDLTYSNSYYFKITVSDTAGVESNPSAQVTAQVQPLVDADIVNSTLTNWPFNGGVVPAGALASGAINASNLFGNDVIVQSAIAANAIGANEIAAGSIIAGKIGANAVTAATIAAGAISADKISANAVTADKINAGAITAVKIAADAITADKIDAGAITADAIAAQAITAAKLESDLTLSNLIKTGDAGTARIEIRGKDHPYPGIVSFDGGGGTTFRFYSNGVSYLDDVTVAGTLTGGTIRTSSSGQRVQLSGSNNSLEIYNSSGTLAGDITGTTGSLFIDSGFGARISMGGGASLGGSSAYSLTASSSGVLLLVVDSTTFSANLRRPSASSVLAVVSSDSRIKSNISSISNGLSVVESLRPVTFNSIVDEENELVSGFIAQEVQTIFPSNTHTIVTETPGVVPNVEGVDADDFTENPLLSLNHIELIPYLTKAIQELSDKNAQLEARIATLEGN